MGRRFDIFATILNEICSQHYAISPDGPGLWHTFTHSLIAVTNKPDARGTVVLRDLIELII